jgi:hypothetical protein
MEMAMYIESVDETMIVAVVESTVQAVDEAVDR